ncbi:MAG: aspartate kinase [bacterium]
MLNKIVVNKFGGEIMGSAELINLAADIIQKQINEGFAPINVVSACSGITDKLELAIDEALGGSVKYKEEVSGEFMNSITSRHLKLCEELLGACDDEIEKDIKTEVDELKKHLDALNKFGEMSVVLGSLMSYGERFSSIIFKAVLEKRGVAAKRYTAENIGIITNDNYIDADIIYEESKTKTLANIQAQPVPVVCGFCGLTKEGRAAVLGRGGSDTTACFLGNVFKAEKICLWKTVDGVLSADPRIVDGTQTIECLTYTEAEESGKVIHDKAMQYARLGSIPVVVANIKNPEKKTKINCHDDKKKIKIITYKKNQTLFEIRSGKMEEYGFLYKVAELFSKYKINMNLIRNTRDAFYIVADNNENIKELSDELIGLGHYLNEKPCAMVNIIGSLDWDLTSKFNALLKENIKDLWLGAFPYKNCARLEAIVGEDEMEGLVRKLHKEFLK